ncbi:MAG: NnrS family protein [Rhodospirillales bacterium]|nr:NnrS family protein [Rhodospirillales bacterium]
MKDARRQPMALLTVGFRPFYLLAGALAAVGVPAWHFAPGEVLGGELYLAGPAWHAHEMVFGFAAAVLTGFLLTAARAWTGLATPSGWRLAALALLWVAGRVLMATGPPLPAIVVDCLFLPCVSLAVAVPVVKARNWRNLPVAAVPALLGGANLLFHLDHVGLIALARASGGALLALDLFALLVALMAGRVIPAFTANAVPAAKPRRNAYVETLAFGTLAVLLVAGPLGPWVPGGAWLAGVAAAGALAHLVRLWLWDPAATRGEPLLWVLPLSYAWLPAALILRALWLADADVPAASAFHALGAGAVGGLMLGMMTRSALGHTGRPLKARAVETTAYVLLHLGAALRVFGPLAGVDAEPHAFAASAVLWSGAFALFLAAYRPILTRPRTDEPSAD